MTERTPLFCDAALAERIERADVQLVTGVARAAHRRNHGRGFVLPLAGGVASFAEPGSLRSNTSSAFAARAMKWLSASATRRSFG